MISLTITYMMTSQKIRKKNTVKENHHFAVFLREIVDLKEIPEIV